MFVCLHMCEDSKLSLMEDLMQKKKMYSSLTACKISDIFQVCCNTPDGSKRTRIKTATVFLCCNQQSVFPNDSLQLLIVVVFL